MSTADVNRGPGRPDYARLAGKVAKRVVPLLILLLFVPWLVVFYAVCGAIDVVRNRPVNGQLLKGYFYGNGVLTWLLSPFNLLMDLLALPYWNKGIYQLEDLPEGHQAEIRELIAAANGQDITSKLDAYVASHDRAMIFFKWYGRNRDVALDIPAFHRDYKYIRTIGVSVFNKRKSTSRHFGPLRVSFRVLYNINDIDDPNAYIVVGDRVSRWCENKLFIFDDTLQHESLNETDAVRYCLFVDILRPSLIPAVFDAILTGLERILSRISGTFYKNWDFIDVPPPEDGKA